ncbi:unnamed protein product [Bursaphelenchus xylophilus]|uniref:(pine wood nematode) hypothetical protein n=1 Tax=Bursaphelenchus xylophilus TaxID=6326 RepID=A0A1I7SQY1_BURXY|nr:cysteine proteinase inhibitor [Bursaphelenchus xylophilus]CAD5222511.1 unnamed protein product [Bursaphelenchus xylophilus]CAG9110552.1 unnamed protein product [Bursaphelenchus xylophilus]
MLFKVTVLFVVLLVAHRSLSEPTQKPRQVLGGFSDVPLDDPLVVRLAKKAVHIFAKQSHQKLKFHQVLAAQKQIVNGENYAIDLEARNLSPNVTKEVIQLHDFVHVPLKGGKNRHNVTEIVKQK